MNKGLLITGIGAVACLALSLFVASAQEIGDKEELNDIQNHRSEKEKELAESYEEVKKEAYKIREDERKELKKQNDDILHKLDEAEKKVKAINKKEEKMIQSTLDDNNEYAKLIDAKSNLDKSLINSEEVNKKISEIKEKAKDEVLNSRTEDDAQAFRDKAKYKRLSLESEKRKQAIIENRSAESIIIFKKYEELGSRYRDLKSRESAEINHLQALAHQFKRFGLSKAAVAIIFSAPFIPIVGFSMYWFERTKMIIDLM